MDEPTNQQIIEGMFQDYAAGNMAAVLACFDPQITWKCPGAPDIPFSGTFKGIQEVMKMFAIQATTVSIEAFSPDKFCTNKDTVVVLGHSRMQVVSTSKSYSTDWVRSYTFKNGKITDVRVYLDTRIIAEACQP